jgi:hypothetical protein
MSTEHASHQHTHEHGPGCAHHTPASTGFRYFVPGLIVGFILGAVVGVLLPELRGGGPALQPRTDSGQVRLHDEEERLNATQVPPDEMTPETVPDAAPIDADGDTKPDAPAAGGGGH